MTKILPKKKQRILEFLANYIQERGYAPTLTEIARKFRLSSPATVHEHLQYLERHGFLRREDGEIELLSHERVAEAVAQDEPYREGESIQLPVIGLITAGAPIEAIEDRMQLLTVPKELVNRKDCYVLKVKGDSMIESCIDDGDYVVVQKQEYANDGDIVVALLSDGSATLKQYYKEKHYIRLQPRNIKYAPIRTKQVVIQGKVAGIIRKL